MWLHWQNLIPPEGNLCTFVLWTGPKCRATVALEVLFLEFALWTGPLRWVRIPFQEPLFRMILHKITVLIVSSVYLYMNKCPVITRCYPVFSPFSNSLCNVGKAQQFLTQPQYNLNVVLVRFFSGGCAPNCLVWTKPDRLLWNTVGVDCCL